MRVSNRLEIPAGPKGDQNSNFSLINFEKIKIPFVPSGDLIKEEEVLEWLKKNRYRHPELNFFMYAITAITGAFILYTLFIIFCIKKKKKDEKTE